jgi:hypothetical protein
MNIDPQKVFMGLMGLCSTLLAGALPTWLLMGEAGPAVLGDRCTKLDGAQSCSAFLHPRYEVNRCTAKVVSAAACDSCGVEMGKRWTGKPDALAGVWVCDACRRLM